MSTDVSVIVPARNEAALLPRTLASLVDQQTETKYEVIVVDGASEDETVAVTRDFDVQLIEKDGSGIGAGRDRGADHATGEWFAFVDADTVVEPHWLDTMRSFLEEQALAAGSSRCRIPGRRATIMAAVINHVFPRLRYPILPGFHCWIRRDVYRSSGGFLNVPNEDTDLSRRIARAYPVGYHPETLVTTSNRRIKRSGLTGTLLHYARLDIGRLQRTRSGG